MGVMDNLAHELTGNINRAYIQMHTCTNSLKDNRYTSVPVQYNPSSITLSCERDIGQGEGQNPAAENAEQYKQEGIYPVTMILQTELIFDDTALADAFSMAESGKFSQTGMVKTAAKGIVGAVRPQRRVQDIAELLISACCRDYTRTVCFCWNKQMFWGELIAVDIQYTMFDRDANPVRAKAAIKIRQDTIEQPQERSAAVNSVKRYQTDAQWEKKFTLMFEESRKLAKNRHLSPTSGKLASNLFNFH